MVEAIASEIQLRRSEVNEPIETIYFGGGTPSILSTEQLAFLLKSLYKTFDIIENVELTLEANPEHLSGEYCLELADMGFNRVSLGVQTFNDDVLGFLNRPHNSKQIFEAVENLKIARIDNLNMDLIYGIPNQSIGVWEENLETLLSLEPKHISAYALTIEEKTAFGNWLQKGKLEVESDENYADQFEVMIKILKEAGFDHYEVSNFALPNYLSKHNTSYWEGKPYLGIGPGAHSFNGTTRRFNVSSNPRYLKLISENEFAFDQEILTSAEQLNEYLLTGLRTKFGIKTSLLREKFGYKISEENQKYLEDIASKDLGSFDGETLILNSSGFLISDSIVLQLMPDA